MKDQDSIPMLHGRDDAAAGWVLRLREREPDARARSEFRAWLERDPENGAAVARALAVWHAVGDAAGEPWMRALLDEARSENHRRLHRRRVRNRMLAAACLVLALFAVGAVWWYATAPTVYSTGIGERRVVQLNDGSRISLDADTRVEVAYAKGHRRLHLLQGRVACDVASDPLRPFSVRAGNKVVVATGTEFSVELISNQIRVVLYRGHVAVLDLNGGVSQPHSVILHGTGGAADVALTPGRELVMPVRTDMAHVNRVNTTQSLAWEHGLLYFDNEPLGSAIQRVNRYSRKRIAVGNAAVARIRISGVFEAGDTAAFISGVTTVFPVRVVDRDGVKTFESRDR